MKRKFQALVLISLIAMAGSGLAQRVKLSPVDTPQRAVSGAPANETRVAAAPLELRIERSAGRAIVKRGAGPSVKADPTIAQTSIGKEEANRRGTAASPNAPLIMEIERNRTGLTIQRPSGQGKPASPKFKDAIR